jgi:hypothetical protein
VLVSVALIGVFAMSEFVSGVYPIGVWLLEVPLLVPLAMVGLATLGARLQQSLGAVLAVLIVLNVVMVSGLAPSLAQVRTVGPDALGPLTVTDGRQFLQQLWSHFRAGPAALADRLMESRGLLITGRVDLPASASLRRYCPWLDDPRRGLPDFLTIHRDTNHPSRTVRRSPAEQRVEAFGFRPIRVVQLPDGPTLIYWRSQGAVPKRCPR